MNRIRGNDHEAFPRVAPADMAVGESGTWHCGCVVRKVREDIDKGCYLFELVAACRMWDCSVSETEGTCLVHYSNSLAMDPLIHALREL